MKKEQCISGSIDLARRGDLSPMVVDMEAFFEFSFWIAEELADLLAEYECQNRKNRPEIDARI